MPRTLLAQAVTAVLVILALSGCGRVTTDIAVHDDGTYDITMVLAASEDELATAGQTPESFTTLLTQQLTSQPGIEAFAVTDYQQDGYAGVEITGENIPGDDGGLFGRGVVRTDADGVHVDVQYPLTTITRSFPPDQTAAIEISTTISFPGTVTEHNGTLVDEATVAWTGNGSTDLDYTASSTSTSTSTDAAAAAATVQPSPDDAGAPAWVLPLALGLGLLVLSGLGTWLVLRNRGG